MKECKVWVHWSHIKRNFTLYGEQKVLKRLYSTENRGIKTFPSKMRVQISWLKETQILLKAWETYPRFDWWRTAQNRK